MAARLEEACFKSDKMPELPG